LTERGRVADYDDHKGWGHNATADGRLLFFHCTAIADGTRTIEVGAAVRFDIVAGRAGRWEAAEVAPR
jgi:cold shock CspA family protein